MADYEEGEVSAGKEAFIIIFMTDDLPWRFDREHSIRKKYTKS
jgi:hypothetical protein